MKTEKIKIASGLVHKVPADLKVELKANLGLLEKWNSLTPIARNEWICWVISVKQRKTRIQHIVRLGTELVAGKRRPCCWLGCIHRRDKPLSPSVEGIINRGVRF